MEEGTEKKTIIDWCKEHPRIVFWVRCILWFLFACALPFTFIAFRYGIFKGEKTLQLTGLGIVAIVIVVVFIIVFIKYLCEGLKGGFAYQCIIGLIAIIIPLCGLLALIEVAKKNMELFEEVLGCVILCEFIGIPLNPFPAWIEKRRKERNAEKGEK